MTMAAPGSSRLEPRSAPVPLDGAADRLHQARSPATRRLTGALLLAWAVVTFVLAYFARDLHFKLFGWPFSFWLGAQGGLLAYLAITWAYARGMDRLDRGAAAPPQPGE